MAENPPLDSISTPNVLDGTRRQPRLTVEVLLWVLVLALALALRLSNLDAAPLNAGEAREAMLAWRTVKGQGMPETGYSPLLFGANALLFSLCGASDALARLWPALFGGALVLAPLLLRRHMGRVGVLAAGACLALSPTALVASRQLDGTVIAVAGGLAFFGGLVCFFDTSRRAWLTLAVVGLALAVAAGVAVYGVLLPLALGGLGLTWAWPDKTAQRMWESIRPHVGWMLAVGVLAGLGASTALGWNSTGLAAAGDLLSTWFERFTLVPGYYTSPFTVAAVYETLPMLFGIGGAVWSIWCGRRLGVLLSLWAGLATLSLVLMRGWVPLDLLWVVLPLALLTGVAVEALVQNARSRPIALSEGLHTLVVFILWGYVYLRLARYARFGDSLDLLMVILTFALQILLIAIFTLTAVPSDRPQNSPTIALRSFVLGTGVALLVLTVSAGWGAAHVRPADPRELLARAPTDAGVRDLVRTLRDLSWRETGMPTTLAFALDAPSDSVLAWYLRDFNAVQRVEDISSEHVVGPILITSQRDWQPGDGTTYTGQDFVLQRSWSVQSVRCIWSWPPQCRTAASWFLHREAPAPQMDQWGVLWIQQDAYAE